MIIDLNLVLTDRDISTQYTRHCFFSTDSKIGLATYTDTIGIGFSFDTRIELSFDTRIGLFFDTRIGLSFDTRIGLSGKNQLKNTRLQNITLSERRVLKFATLQIQFLLKSMEKRCGTTPASWGTRIGLQPRTSSGACRKRRLKNRWSRFFLLDPMHRTGL